MGWRKKRKMGEILVGSETTLASLPPNWSTCQQFHKWYVLMDHMVRTLFNIVGLMRGEDVISIATQFLLLSLTLNNSRNSV